MKRLAITAIVLLQLAGCSNKGDATKPAGERPAADTQRVTVNLEAKLNTGALELAFDLPKSWEVAKLFGGPSWRPKGSGSTYLLITKTCGGKCKVEEMDANIERIFAAKRAGEPGPGSSYDSKMTLLDAEVLADEPLANGRLLHRRLAKAGSAPDRFNIICVARTKEMPFFVFVQAQGPIEEEAAHAPAILAACKSLEILSVKPR